MRQRRRRRWWRRQQRRRRRPTSAAGQRLWAARGTLLLCALQVQHPAESQQRTCGPWSVNVRSKSNCRSSMVSPEGRVCQDRGGKGQRRACGQTWRACCDWAGRAHPFGLKQPNPSVQQRSQAVTHSHRSPAHSTAPTAGVTALLEALRRWQRVRSVYKDQVRCCGGEQAAARPRLAHMWTPCRRCNTARALLVPQRGGLCAHRAGQKSHRALVPARPSPPSPPPPAATRRRPAAEHSCASRPHEAAQVG